MKNSNQVLLPSPRSQNSGQLNKSGSSKNKKASELNIPVIRSMGTGNKMNPIMLEVCDISKTSVCPLAKVMRYELRKRNIKNVKVIYSKEEPLKLVKDIEDTNGKRLVGSSAFVPPVAGYIIASEVIKDFLKD